MHQMSLTASRDLETSKKIIKDSQTKVTIFSEESVLIVKSKYEAEIGDWRVKYEDSQNIIAQMKIEIGNIKQDNQQLNLKYAGLVGGDEILLVGCDRLVPFRGGVKYKDIFLDINETIY